MSAESKKIFDFLYADHEKVASILSQIEDGGAPSETSVRAQRGKDNKAGLSAKLAGIGGDASVNRNLQYEVRQTYDPLWVNSRKLIEHVGALGSSSEIDIGQIRVFDGSLVAFDQSVLPKLMSSSSMRDFIAAGMDGSQIDGKRNIKAFNENKKEADVIQTYIASLDLGIQFVLNSMGTGFWFNINRNNLYLHEMDIPLKFPVIISGEWKVLGIIDALPNDQFALDHLDEMGAADHIPAMLGNLGQLIGFTSVLFGRRLDSYGIKPLAIFREIDIPSLIPSSAILNNQNQSA